MKLGMVTYQWGAKWDLETLIRNCELTGFEAVELRSTHAHGVEPSLTNMERLEIRQRFEDSRVTCLGPGSACEFHSPDPAVVRKNIEETKSFVVLSYEIGGSGVKVRPNSLVEGEDPEKTIDRIGRALRECGRFAADHNQEIRLEVHGRGTQKLDVIAGIIEAAGHPAVAVCWNSNPGETVGGSIRGNFELVKGMLGATVHVHDLYDPEYPYRELFSLLREVDYQGYCLSESPETSDPIRVMRYYKALWEELIRR